MKEYIISFPSNAKVLEIGGGQKPIFHPNMDLLDVPEVDIVYNLEKFPYPFKDEEFDGVVGLYVIEHISWRKFDQFLREIYRILKREGTAIFLTANLYEQCKKVLKEGVNKGTVEMIFGSQEFPNHAGVHKMGFSPEYAQELFSKASFEVKVISPMPDVYYKNIPLYPACETDMVIEATKPKVKIL